MKVNLCGWRELPQSLPSQPSPPNGAERTTGWSAGTSSSTMADSTRPRRRQFHGASAQYAVEAAPAPAGQRTHRPQYVGDGALMQGEDMPSIRTRARW